MMGELIGAFFLKLREYLIMRFGFAYYQSPAVLIKFQQLEEKKGKKSSEIRNFYGDSYIGSGITRSFILI